MYKPYVIALFFLHAGSKEKIGITPKKLQRLVYFANGFYSALNGKSLLNEKVEAWDFGPVIPSLWEIFKFYGDKEIPVGSNEMHELLVPEINKINPLDLNFLQVVWNVLKLIDDNTLSSMTHLNDSPWNTLVQEKKGNLQRGQDIEDDEIRSYFTKELNGV